MNDNDMVSLTDFWKMSGGNHHEKPALWVTQTKSQEFIDAVAKKLKVSKSALLETRAGRYNGGTYAHWQVAMAYAKCLNPELHMAINEVFKQFVEADASLAVSVLEQTKDNATVKTQTNHF